MSIASLNSYWNMPLKPKIKGDSSNDVFVEGREREREREREGRGIERERASVDQVGLQKIL